MKTLTKLIYLEADEEITDLVDRLRELRGEEAVSLVLPEQPRAVQSAMSFRLLRRYAQSFGMHLNVISADPRIQSLALESGFSAYPTVDAYDRGLEVHRPQDQPAPAPVPDEVDSPADRIVTSARPVVSAAPRRPAPLSADFLTKPRIPALSWPAMVAGGLVVLLAATATVLFLPTATVTLAVSGTKLEQQVQLVGAPSAAGGSSDRFQTRALEASASQSAQGTATGQKLVGANFATTEVTISNGRITDLTYPRTLEVCTSDDVRFQLDRDLPLARGKEGTVRVTASRPGVSSNVEAGRIIRFCDSSWRIFGTVTNKVPASGGTDARTATVIEQHDIDTAKKALLDQLDPKVQNDLHARAPGLHFVPESLDLKQTVTTDRKAGDEADTFNITLAIAGRAAAFDDEAVRNLLGSALRRRVPPGKELTEDPIQVSYLVTSASGDGNVALDGVARAFVRPIFSAADIRARITGKSPQSARTQLRQFPNVVDVSVRGDPISLPWLPLFSSRINVRIKQALA